MQQTAEKALLRKKLKLYFKSFIAKNTFTLKELQELNKNAQPFPVKQ